VATPEAVIDLDLLPAEPDRPGRPRVPWRWVLTVAVLALASLALTGAAAPAGPAVSPVRTVTVENVGVFRVIDDTLYVVQARPGEQRLYAYPVEGGPARWSTRLDMLAGPPQLVAVGDVVLVMSFDPGPIVRVQTQALDRRTGVVRWENPLTVGAVDTRHGRVLLGDPVRIDRVDEDRGGTVVAVAADTGQPVWSYRRDPGCAVGLPGYDVPDGSALGVLCPDGTLSAVDVSTGRVRNTVQGAVQRAPNSVGFGIDVYAVKDRILVTYPMLGATVFASFDAQRLTPQWTVNVDQRNYGVSDCGSRLCLYAATGGIQALDPATGETRWRLPLGIAGYGLDDRHVLAALSKNQTELVDGETGRSLVRLDGWTVVPFRTGRPLFYRSDRGAHRMWVATLSRDNSALQPLGQVANPNADVSDCVTSERYLACRTVKDTIQVWRVRPPD
jgi:outer membrane protein assembly factor BamB